MPDYVFCSLPAPVNAQVSVPGSKSLTNRALVLATLAHGTSILRHVLLAEDTWLMIEALRRLGISITVDSHDQVAEVTGCGGHIPAAEAEIDCGNSGTTMRFCTALCAVSHGGGYRLDGVARMRQRPIGGLADALWSLGAGIEFAANEGFPPLIVHAQGLRGGHVAIDSPASSQFVSALLMVAPMAASDVLIEVAGDAPSVPFIRMTVRLMEKFGVPTLADGLDSAKGSSAIRLVVEAPQVYQGLNYAVEPDATNAMYFLSAPAVVGGRVTVKGIGQDSLQGDVEFLRVLEQMGCQTSRGTDALTVARDPQTPLRGVDFDLGPMPDLAPTLAVLALLTKGPTTIRNIANLRVKESDRIAALARELSKLGAGVEVLEAGLKIHPPEKIRPSVIDTYDDHRMAMSFALAGLACPGLTIRNVECTAKTYPDFFKDFQALKASG